jgi:Tol biopolymer transport system component
MRFKAGMAILVAAALVALPGVTPAAHATSPGQNGLISFDPGGSTIATLDPHGNGVADYLTTGAHDGDPAWTAGGHRIFFVHSFQSGGDTGYEVLSVRVADKRLREYMPISWNKPIFDPWPVPGGGFVYSQRPSDFGVLQIFRQAGGLGSEVTQLTNTTSRDNVCPVPSPDGSRIAFVRSGRGLFVMKADGSGKTLLGPGVLPTCIDWAPNGSMIAGAVQDPDGESQDVVLLNVSTGQQTILSSTQSGFAGFGSVSFSPNGRRLLVVQYSGFGDTMMTYSLQGTNPRLIPYHAQDEATGYFSRAEWQPVP